MRPDEHAEYEQWAGDTCFGVWQPEKVGMALDAQTGNPLPLRVEDVHAARAELESKGVDLLRRDVRHRRLPHGDLRRPRRQPAHAAPPVRALRERVALTIDFFVYSRAAPGAADAEEDPALDEEHWSYMDAFATA